MVASDLNPPEVQRYVVEHVVRSGDGSMHLNPSQRLITFSGKVPMPAHEMDFDTWRSGVEMVLKDPSTHSTTFTEQLSEQKISIEKQLASLTAAQNKSPHSAPKM